MEEMNSELRKQIEEIVKRIEDLAPNDRVSWEKLADVYLESMKDKPVCFWVRIFQVAQDVTDPVLQTRLCEKYDQENDRCLAGRSNDECRQGCKDYVGIRVDYSGALECDGKCESHQPGESGPGRKTNA